MKRLVIIVLLIVLCSGIFAMAQEDRRGEIFGGYQYASWQAGSSISNRVSIHGWDAGVAAYLTPNFAIAGDLGGIYKDPLGVYTFMGGPRFHFGRKVSPFIEGLFGGTKFARTLPDGSSLSSETFFSFAFGGGIDVQATNRIAIRVIRLDYHGIRAGGTTVNNVRITPGIVFTF